MILSNNTFNSFPPVVFITGTGTDVGKSYATGWLAKQLIEHGSKCITQKFIQTGNINRSEDIELHRRIMGVDFFEEDNLKLTYPEVFSYPCSPDLASKIDKRKIDFKKIKESTEVLQSKYDHVLIEGAGGIMVPLEGGLLTADYIKQNKYPVILVVSGELGSINHALLSLLAIKNYEIELFGIIYNPYFDKDLTICNDTREYLKKWISQNFKYDVKWREMTSLT